MLSPHTVPYRHPLLGLEQPTVDDDGNVQDSLIALECLCGGYKRLTGCLPERPQGPSDKCDERVYEARLEMIMLPAIKGLLDKKWDYFGKPIFKRKRRFFFVVQILWTISVVIPNHYRSKPTNLSEVMPSPPLEPLPMPPCFTIPKQRSKVGVWVHLVQPQLAMLHL